MDFGPLETAIHDWVAAAVAAFDPAVTVTFDDPDETRPPTPYVRLKLMGPARIGHDTVTTTGTDVTLSGLRGLTLSVNAYGKAATAIASAIQTSVDLPDTVERLRLASASTTTVGAIRDLSQWLETTYERRAQFDVGLLAPEAVAVAVDTFETVAVDTDIGGVTATIEAG